MSKNRKSRRAQDAKQKRQHARASRREPQTPSPSRALRAVRALDNFAPVRDGLGRLAEKVGEWAGIPVPIEGETLIVEPTYPWAKVFEGTRIEEEDDGWIERNRWYCRRRRCEIILMEKDGKLSWGLVPGFHHIDFDLRTIGCSQAWGIEQEGKAVQLLGRLLRHHQFKQYLMTGMFIESSVRSGVTYVFRKLKPTIALAAHPGRPEFLTQPTRILAALCMHPIGYYAQSWAGAMTPTDDVIAHLSLMRGDEAMYWKRCTQHPPYRPEAGM